MENNKSMQAPQLEEVGAIAACIADNLFDEIHKRQKKGGVVDAYYLISKWAQEFYQHDNGHDWEAITMGDKEYKPLSKEYGSVGCWDEAVVDFAYSKLEKL